MTQPIPQGYKQTEIGVIPEDWATTRLENIVQFRNGVAHEDCINENGQYIVVNSKFISTDGKVEKRSKECRLPAFKNDILMVMSDVPNGRAIARCYLVNHDNTYTVNQRICAVNAKNDNSVFLLYQLNRNPFYLSFDDGAKQTNLRRQDVLNCLIPLPPKPEQTAIATALSDVDALISGLESLIAKKQAIKTATMQKLLTGKTRLPQFAYHPDGTAKGYKHTELGLIPEDWGVESIGNKLKIRHGKSQRDIELEGGLYPILATGGQIGTTNTALYKKPSILIGRKGTIDRPQFIDTPFWTVDTLFYSELSDEVDSKFLYNKFCMIDWRSYNEASGVPSLNASTIENVLISMPISKSEQTAIAQILSDMDEEIQALEARLSKTKQIKQGMMQVLLTGKVRLI